MKPNFKEINIKNVVASEAHKPLANGEEWLTAELIPVKPIYTKE